MPDSHHSEGGSPPDPKHDRVEAIVADMRLCALRDRVNAMAASTQHLPEMRVFLKANAVLVELWAAQLESLYRD